MSVHRNSLRLVIKLLFFNFGNSSLPFCSRFKPCGTNFLREPRSRVYLVLHNTFSSNAIERLQIQAKQHAKLQNTLLIGFALLKLSLCAQCYNRLPWQLINNGYDKVLELSMAFSFLHRRSSTVEKKLLSRVFSWGTFLAYRDKNVKKNRTTGTRKHYKPNDRFSFFLSFFL